MIKIGLGEYSHWVFSTINVDIIEETKWKNIELSFRLAKGTIPDELTEPSILVVIDDGTILDMVLQNEGVDCEYKLTELEKEQLTSLLKQKKLIG